MDWRSFFSSSPANFTTLCAQWLAALPFFYLIASPVEYFIGFAMIGALPVQVWKIKERRKLAVLAESGIETED